MYYTHVFSIKESNPSWHQGHLLSSWISSWMLPWKHWHRHQNRAVRSTTYQCYDYTYFWQSFWILLWPFWAFWKLSWKLKSATVVLLLSNSIGFHDPENVGIDIRIALSEASLTKLWWFYVILDGPSEFFGGYCKIFGSHLGY